MTSEDEKKRILRTVNMFAEGDDDTLMEVVHLIEDVQVPAGELIIRQGDIGDCMYIIVEGKVRVFQGEHTLNFLGRRQVVGELAVLDSEPRVASVAAVEDTHMWRLDQKELYDLMSHRVEVTRGIIHALCQQLRTRVVESAADFKYIQQFNAVTAAAAAIEAGIFEPESLDDVGARGDALGQLARVFQRMTREVYAREQQLKRQVEDLRIEIDRNRAAMEVAEITDTDYFRNLQSRARQLRELSRDNTASSSGAPD
jgi:CRP-like cAMP-binding protein